MDGHARYGGLPAPQVGEAAPWPAQGQPQLPGGPLRPTMGQTVPAAAFRQPSQPTQPTQASLPSLHSLQGAAGGPASPFGRMSSTSLPPRASHWSGATHQPSASIGMAHVLQSQPVQPRQQEAQQHAGSGQAWMHGTAPLHAQLPSHLPSQLSSQSLPRVYEQAAHGQARAGAQAGPLHHPAAYLSSPMHVAPQAQPVVQQMSHRINSPLPAFSSASGHGSQPRYTAASATQFHLMSQAVAHAPVPVMAQVPAVAVSSVPVPALAPVAAPAPAVQVPRVSKPPVTYKDSDEDVSDESDAPDDESDFEPDDGEAEGDDEEYDPQHAERLRKEEAERKKIAERMERDRLEAERVARDNLRRSTRKRGRDVSTSVEVQEEPPAKRPRTELVVVPVVVPEDPQVLEAGMEQLRSSWRVLVLLHFLEHFRECLELPAEYSVATLLDALVSRRQSDLLEEVCDGILKHNRGYRKRSEWFRMLYNAHNRHPFDMPDGNPLADVEEEDFFSLAAKDKATALYWISGWALEESEMLHDQVDAWRKEESLMRPLPLGYDKEGNAYWRFGSDMESPFLFKEVDQEQDEEKAEGELWRLQCRSPADWEALLESLTDTKDDDEKEFASYIREELLEPLSQAAVREAARLKRMRKCALQEANIIDVPRSRRAARNKTYAYADIDG